MFTTVVPRWLHGHDEIDPSPPLNFLTSSVCHADDANTPGEHSGSATVGASTMVCSGYVKRDTQAKPNVGTAMPWRGELHGFELCAVLSIYLGGWNFYCDLVELENASFQDGALSYSTCDFKIAS